MADPEQIAALRDFNRFYTTRLGMTRHGLHKTDHPLAEARVLYELGAHGVLETSALKDALAIDAGQLSRLVKRLQEQGLIHRTASPADARRQQVELTGEGEAAFARLDQGSREEVGALLDALPDPEGALAAIQKLREAIEPTPTRDVRLRDLRIGDLGWLVERHGVLYATEYGWDGSFERMVAGIAAAFDPEHDRAWVAEVDGQRAGAVLCVHDTPANAKLRTLLVEPHARGLGLGTRLVNAVIEHARRQRYRTVTLWTNDILHAARHIYERAGFTLHSEAPHHAFGHDLTEQTWSLTLQPWTETH
ncbi:helix-turn-helix domain-containing GNAT family N-acetyltransferase [Solirubrobacter ginsenosidimutans]|uniref:Helix-turn-helix domain-containing GNAT family N-acetyltransferase n=1 Tax=Solirubrobacter ginsenosidimutans TaxID=490573 RepID=A0A9X3N4E3_9ACTN|nr:helix-turn-helix domain-containing GNAT family N-acetyltransferase [Solirubrobacter ginsenosidimutans]MDA0166462.1 helix-turn-helix domain-containing GNAT family N-acetyltransferase [Solirubrobacter ginsenosidimutans]